MMLSAGRVVLAFEIEQAHDHRSGALPFPACRTGGHAAHCPPENRRAPDAWRDRAALQIDLRASRGPTSARLPRSHLERASTHRLRHTRAIHASTPAPISATSANCWVMQASGPRRSTPRAMRYGSTARSSDFFDAALDAAAISRA